MTLESFLALLPSAKRSGHDWVTRCPVHDDLTASLSVTDKNGRILLNCFAGCATKDICSALGVSLRDLFTTASGHARTLDASLEITAYDYCDEQRRLLYQVVRFAPKDFRVRRPKEQGGWIWDLNGVRRVLYRLPDVLACQDLILICEGEKDCDSSRTLGLVATCNALGAGKWCDEYSEMLRGKVVVIVADGDDAGRKHAQAVAESIADKVAVTLKLIELPGAKDLSEWITRGGTREALLELIRDAPAWKATRMQTATVEEGRTQKATPLRAAARVCYARRHMPAAINAFHAYAASISHKSGVFYSNARRDAWEFGTDKGTILRWTRALEKAGWFERIDHGRRLKRNRATGLFLPMQFRVMDHDTWACAHPGSCRFPDDGLFQKAGEKK